MNVCSLGIFLIPERSEVPPGKKPIKAKT